MQEGYGSWVCVCVCVSVSVSVSVCVCVCVWADVDTSTWWPWAMSLTAKRRQYGLVGLISLQIRLNGSSAIFKTTGGRQSGALGSG